MRKGMLTTLSALPAEDTENHHHTTIKKKRGGSCVVPTGSHGPRHSLLRSLWGEPQGFLWLQQRLLRERGNTLY